MVYVLKVLLIKPLFFIIIYIIHILFILNSVMIFAQPVKMEMIAKLALKLEKTHLVVTLQ